MFISHFQFVYLMEAIKTPWAAAHGGCLFNGRTR